MPLLTWRLASSFSRPWQPWEAHSRFRLEIDWAGNGAFASPFDDVSSDTVGAVQTVRGRDYASQLSGRSVAGRLTATLRNEDGKYSSFKTDSPLYGYNRPGLKVRAWVQTPFTSVLWTGRMDTLEPVSGAPEPRAQLTASGVLKQLGDLANLVSVAPITSGAVSEAVDDVLDAAGFPSTARAIDTTAVPLMHWWVEQKPALQALQELEETEIGFLAEGTDWDVLFRNRYHRNLVTVGASVTFSDHPLSNYPYVALQQNEPVRDIYNQMSAEVTPYSAGALAVLWTLSPTDVAYLPPGGSLKYRASFTNGYVNPWTDPVVGTDILATGGTLGVSGVVKTAQGMEFLVTNSHATAGATLTLVQARGVAYTASQPYQVTAQDASSRTKFGARSYPLSSPWYPNSAYAQSAIDYFISLRKDPHPVLTMTVFAANPGGTFYALIEAMASLRLSERVAVDATKGLTMLGIEPLAPDFFVEAISHVFGGAIPWTTTYLLSPVPDPVGVNYWILADSNWGALGLSTRLAF